MRQHGISRKLYTNRQWSVGDYLMHSVLMFSKRATIVSKPKGSILDKGSPKVLASLEILNLMIPLVFSTLLDEGE